MNKRPYNEESISQYLLGTLSEAETEWFDELSFTDDQFVESVKAVERDLIDAYVQGQLRNSPARQFEARYLASPLKRENVELARAFYDYRESRAHDIAKEPTSRAADHPTLFPFARWRWQWGLVGLASLILALVAWSVFVSQRRNSPTDQSLSGRSSPEQQQSPASAKSNEPLQARTPETTGPTRADVQQPVVEDQRQQRSASSKVQIASVVLSPQMRGSTDIPLINVPAKTQQLAIRLELEPNDYSVYRVVLLDQTEGSVLWRAEKVFGQTKGGSKMVNIQLPLQRLQSRSYVLQVYGLTEGGKGEQMSDYHFRVVK